MFRHVAMELLRRAGAECAFAVQVPRSRYAGSNDYSRWLVWFGCDGRASDEEERAGCDESESGDEVRGVEGWM